MRQIQKLYLKEIVKITLVIIMKNLIRTAKGIIIEIRATQKSMEIKMIIREELEMRSTTTDQIGRSLIIISRKRIIRIINF